MACSNVHKAMVCNNAMLKIEMSQIVQNIATLILLRVPTAYVTRMQNAWYWTITKWKREWFDNRTDLIRIASFHC